VDGSCGKRWGLLFDRDGFAGLQQHHVAGDELSRGNPQFLTAAAHRGLGDDHLCQRVDGLFRLRLLMIADDGIDENHSENDRFVHPFTESDRDACGCEQDVNERLVELQKEAHPFAEPLLRGHLDRSESLSAVVDLRCRESAGRIHVQTAKHLSDRHLVPRMVRRLFHGVFFGREVLESTFRCRPDEQQRSCAVSDDFLCDRAQQRFRQS
jgi:hypothetical protein